MSFVEKAYNHGLKIVKILNSKIFHFFLIFFGALALIFGVMNVYAQEETLRISPDFPGNKAVYNTASGVDPDQDNTTSYGGTSLLNTSWVTAISLAPSLTEGGDAVLNNADIPNDMKYGLLGITDSAWAGIYRNTPSVDLIAHLGNEWVPGYDESSYGTYADDGANVSGYQSLIDSGIAPLWTQFRNMSYVFLVIIMLVIGFMIMFRSKIGGQLMVSVGNTIPSVIVSLILITFSFAIAGLIIDIGGILVSLLYSIFEQKSISIQNFGALFDVLFRGVSVTDYFEVVGNDFTNAFNGFSTSIGSGLLLWMKASFQTTVFGVVGMIMFVVGLGVVAVGAIKLLIVLYKTYFELILNVILAPFKILMGTIPGKDVVRTNWITSLMRNVLIFPMVYFIVNIPIYLSSVLGEDNVVLGFPSKLTGANLGDTGLDISTGEGYIGLLINFILRVFVLYYAAQAPKFAEAIIPPLEVNKAAADAMANAKMSLSKAPFVGGLFK